MIGIFPDPYPDERLYSIVARFQARMKFPGRMVAIKELFGAVSVTTAVDLPSHLGNLVSSLPPGNRYTVDRFIDEHTLFPFYAPFLPPDRAKRLREDMQGRAGTTVQMRSGVMASSIRPPDWLRYCPLCWNEDEQRFGERYWHRLHQLPGVEVCPFHAVFFRDSDVPRCNQWNRYDFVPAGDIVVRGGVPPVHRDEPSHQTLLSIAEDASWLLSKRGSAPGLAALRRRYLRLLAGRRLATYNGRVRAAELLEAFTARYGVEMLTRLQCGVDAGSEGNWLLRLVRSPKGSQHPIRHLLLIRFLGLTAEDFFRTPEDAKPFGDRPWPCLNPASDHYRQPKVVECDLTSKREAGRPVGTFRCNCGFIYSRLGPDRTAEDRFRFDRVKVFGLQWEWRLKDLWVNETVSFREIARRLRVDPLTVKRHAERLGLSCSRPGGKTQTASVAPSPRLVSGAGVLGVRDSYRTSWLSALSAHPGVGRKALRSSVPGVYSWLWRNDPEWLMEHLPPPQPKSRPSPSRIDWEARDAQLADAVRFATQRIKDKPGRPVWVTASAIGCTQPNTTALGQAPVDRRGACHSG